jgi:hypothetical protein
MNKPRYKGTASKRDGTQHLALPFVVLDSPGYRAIGHIARSLLLDIARQYTGHNNGKLVACAKYLKPKGWSSNATITKALRELVAVNLLIETRKGARPNKAAWFALGWLQLDVAEGLDIDPKAYRTGRYQNASLTPASGVARLPIAPTHGVRAAFTTPASGAMQ